MTPDTLFQTANPLAMLGWLTLAFSPIAPTAMQRVGSVVVPLLLSTAYAAIVLVYWQSGEGGFDSLTNVATLFENRWLLLAGWMHYLAFDLLIGGWEARTARRTGIPHWLLVPCLGMTFLFGPAGYLLFQFVRLSRRVQSSSANV